MQTTQKLLTFLIVWLLLSPAALAARISSYVPAVERVVFQGQIEVVKEACESFVVQEREVCLVDFIQDGRRYQTAILNLDGSSMSPAQLVVGAWVAVKGVVLADGRVGAKVIYLLPRQLSRAEAAAYPVLMSEPDWGQPVGKP